MTGLLFDIEEGTIHDGPGLRITVFLKGCPLRCRWCHSPEGQSFEPERLSGPGGDRWSGTRWEAADLADYLNRNGRLLGKSGGITFSGGEPLAQADFLLEVLRLLEGSHTLLETSGVGNGDRLAELASKVNFIHYGLKLLDPTDAQTWTGMSSAPALANLRELDDSGRVNYAFRLPLLAGITDTERNLKLLQELSGTLKHLTRIDFLPSNPAAPAKYAACGRTFDETRDLRPTGTVPEWFSPGVPWAILK